MPCSACSDHFVPIDRFPTSCLGKLWTMDHITRISFRRLKQSDIITVSSINLCLTDKQAVTFPSDWNPPFSFVGPRGKWHRSKCTIPCMKEGRMVCTVVANMTGSQQWLLTSSKHRCLCSTISFHSFWFKAVEAIFAEYSLFGIPPMIQLILRIAAKCTRRCWIS